MTSNSSSTACLWVAGVDGFASRSGKRTTPVGRAGLGGGALAQAASATTARATPSTDLLEIMRGIDIDERDGVNQLFRSTRRVGSRTPTPKRAGEGSPARARTRDLG